MHSLIRFVAPVYAIGDLLPQFKAPFRDSFQVECVLGVEYWLELACCLVSDLQSLGIEVDRLDQEFVVMTAEGEVHFGDGLILCAEDQPKLIPGNICANLEAFSGSQGQLFIESDLIGQFQGILDPFFDE